MKFFILLLLCIGCPCLITADCIIDELDIVVTINRQPKSVCSFRNENFHEGRSVRECNIDCTCMVGRLTCCSKSKTHCQRAESCRKVIFDFNTSLFTRSLVTCEEKVKTKLVPVYDHISKNVVKSKVVTIQPPQQIKLTTPAKIVEPPPENIAQRKRRLNIARIMRINRARRRKLARAQRRKASAKSTSVKKPSSISNNSSQKGMSLLDRLRYNGARRRQTMKKKTRVASAQVDKNRAASGSVGKQAIIKEQKQATKRFTFEQMIRKNHERRLRKMRKKLSKGRDAVQSKEAASTKETKQASEGLTYEEMFKKNHERRLRKMRKKLSQGTAAVQSKKAASTKETKQASDGLTYEEMFKKNHERRLRKMRKKLSKGTAAVQSTKAASTKEKKKASEGLTYEEMLRRDSERRNKKRRRLNANRSSYLLNAMRRNRLRRERLRQQRLANLNKSQ
ncbi:hypothetical protein LOTGIDRAFT_232225 [Lottia gigantea]|uniref:Uncharacterized protein n=1 Tax=Lottia gigantea TaxID=225164 RepID=V4ANF0_LOTGI|nr:hypothetical protein LOTGIDRAFT_232225 [Lottia gigantea]ESO95146.1 hypothetical protein LOTGIDRAFT_232225 [Lottia gigantea]